jgi:hypothetical protein
MLRHLLLAAASVALSASAIDAQRAPVLVELFTSEGCSSCPPADRLLERLDPQAIVLSEHVDYFDGLGWKDRFSSHVFTERQEAYARRFALDGPYTPQMVVDGAAEFVGSDARAAADEIGKAAVRPKVAIRLARTGASIRIGIDGSPNAADIWLAVADNSASSQVAAGENKGHELHHVAVVRSFRKIASLKRGASYGGEIALPASAAAQRVVVFLQESGQARVVGAAMLPAGAE